MKKNNNTRLETVSDRDLDTASGGAWPLLAGGAAAAAFMLWPKTAHAPTVQSRRPVGPKLDLAMPQPIDP